MQTHLKDIGEYEILHVELDKNQLPVWIVFNYDMREYRAGLNQTSFTLSEAILIGKEVEAYYRGRAIVRRFGDNRFEAIFLQKNPDYVPQTDGPIDVSDVVKIFKEIR